MLRHFNLKMDIISSNSNKYVKLLKSLSDKKSRDENGLFLAEGERLIKDMPSDYSTEFMLVAQNKLDEFSYLTAGKKFFAATESVIKYACDTVTPSGIVAAVKKVSRPFELPRSNALLLDSLQDSGNVGTIIRTAVSCGFDDIYLYRCADAFSPKAVRASMSGIFKARVYEVNYGECKTLLTGTNSYALDMDGDNLFKANLIGKVVFVAGSEAHGVSDEIKSLCKGSVALPMGNNMESLNVAVATGVAMYYTVNTNN